jgi:hypothetical protein
LQLLLPIGQGNSHEQLPMRSRTALLIIDVQIGLVDGLPAYQGGEVAQRIAHHNEVLDGFRAGRHGSTVKAAASVAF